MLKVYNTIWVSLLVILLIISVKYAFISTDAPFYLSVARDLANGKEMYKDIFNVYTPIMMYLNSFIHKIFNNPGYHAYLVFQYFIILLSTFFFFKICLKHRLDRKVALFLSTFLFLSILSSDGTYIILEIYVILFVLISYWYFQKNKFFLCGLVLSLAFLSKQYGILNFIPFTLLIYTLPDFNKKFLLRFLIGACVPVALFLSFNIYIKEVSIASLYLQLSGQGYEVNMKDVSFSFIAFLSGAKIFILVICPFLFMNFHPFKNQKEGILILGVILNLIPLFIQNFAHYFILTFPYVFILLALKSNDLNKKSFYACNIGLLIICTLLFSRIIKYRNVYNEQLAIAEKYKETIPLGSTVFLYKGYRHLYLMNDYENPVVQTIGYSYGFKPDKNFIKKYKVLMDEDE